MELRRAGLGDAEAIAGISVRTWQHAYSDFIDPRELFERTIESQLPLWEARLARDAVSETWVADVGGRVAGYASVGPSGDGDAVAGLGSLLALYVDPPAQGAGLGRTLHSDAVERLRASFSAATLWIFSANEMARGFYERHGWTLDPSGAGQEGADWLSPAVRYRRDF